MSEKLNNESDKAASSAVETIVMRAEWISVDDELPEIGTPVLCYDNSICRYPFDCPFDVAIFKGQYSHSVYDEDVGKVVEAYKWPLFENIESKFTRNYTHWTPLPKPPK
jgi:hypothetical protein